VRNAGYSDYSTNVLFPEGLKIKFTQNNDCRLAYFGAIIEKEYMARAERQTLAIYLLLALAMLTLGLNAWVAWQIAVSPYGELSWLAQTDLSGLLPIVVALVFWGAGVLILSFQQGDLQSRLFFLFCQAVSAILATGSLSVTGRAWVDTLFYVLMLWIVPLIFHFHMYFPAREPGRGLHQVKRLLYAIAILGSLYYVYQTWTSKAFLTDALFSAPYILRRIWLATGFVGMALLLVRAYYRQETDQSRKQVGILVLGGLSALLPFLGLTLIPDILLNRPILPYPFAFLFLLSIPISYGYAILHYRFIPLERHASRVVITTFTTALLGGLYLAISALLVRLIPSALFKQPLALLVIILLTSALFGLLGYGLRRSVITLFYGGWYDYRSAVRQMTQTIFPASDPSALAAEFVERLQSTMQLKCACLRQADGKVYTAGVDRENPGCIAQRFETEGIRTAEAEATWLTCPRMRIRMPLAAAQGTVGVLNLGAKRGGGEFTAIDRDILEVITRHIGITLEDALLIAELEQHNQERTWLYRQTLSAREDERKRLARELHDGVIQALVGLNYRLSQIRRSLKREAQTLAEQSQADVRSMLVELRRICADLRPPALGMLDLATVAQGVLREADNNAGWRSRLVVDGDSPENIPEDISLCAYRVLQEALLNAQRHSRAEQVEVSIRFAPQFLHVSIADDGTGFVVPSRLGLFAQEGHFGLLGIAERVELANGRLEIRSSPGRGCRLDAWLPLDGRDGKQRDNTTAAERPG
jgi:signal transduction histidine kinase